MTSLRLYFPATLAGAMLWALIPASASGLTIQFNYDYDSSEFFDPASGQGAQARATLENAGRNFEMFTDNLEAIVPGGNNTWSAGFFSPSTGSWVYEPGLVVPADTMIVYVGARNIGSLTLGMAGPGGYSSVVGSSEWGNTVKARGQSGALATLATDLGPWGGSISFNSSSDWNYDLSSGPASNDENDFLSTCLHELCHVLGFGTEESWDTLINTTNNTFTGAASEALYGGPVPLADRSHWATGTESLSGGQVQEVAMAPSLLQGTRKRLTLLDVAGLDDIGWDMPDAGDANLDGDIDASDYITLKRNFAQSATWTGGDFDFDGTVTLLDLAALEASFNNSPAGAPIPEPTTLFVILAASLPTLLKRRRSRAQPRGRRRRS